MVFSEFREKENVIDPIAYKYIKAYKQRIGLDYGWINPTALVWGCVNYDGEIIIFDEWGGTQQLASEIALQARRYGKMPIIADYSIKRPDRDGRSLWDDLSASGLSLEPSNKQELEGIVLINSLLKSKRLLITKNCVNLINEMNNYKWQRLRIGQDKNHSETPVDKDNHFLDGLRYLCASLEELRTPDPRKKQRERSLEYANIQPPRRSPMS